MACPICGEPLEEPAKCRRCSPVLVPAPAISRAQGSPIGTVVASPPDRPDGSRVEYRPASGGQSVSQTDAQGAFTAELSKGLVSGRKNEPYAVRCLVAVLKQAGHDVHLERGARDDDGEDQLVLIDGKRFTVQVVTLPAEDRVRHTLNAQSRFVEAGDSEKAVGWLRNALRKKRHAKGTIVVLDAHHFGALVGRKLVGAYLAVHPEPVEEFGFKDVWIIGPTPPFSVRLG